VATRLMSFVPALAWQATKRTEPEARQGLKPMYGGRFRICLMSCLISQSVRIQKHRPAPGRHQLPL